MADSTSPTNTDKLVASDFLNRFDSGLIYGILGTAVSGIALAAGFLPPIIGTYATPLAVGTVLFIAEVVNGAVNGK